MDSWSERLAGLLGDHAQPLLTWGGALLPPLLALMILRPYLRRLYEEWQISRVICRLAADARRNVMLDDGMDGYAFIDYLLLTVDRIVVLSVQRIHGVVFAAEGIEQWANVVGSRSYKFDNPLPVVEAGVAAVKRLLPEIEVEGRLLFACNAAFPKGRPPQVLLPQDLAKGRRPKLKQLPERLGAAWRQVTGELQPIPDSYHHQLAVIGNDGCRRRLSLVVILLLLDLAWLGWRLL